MEIEATDLDRQVLAHARILQTLIRYLAEDRPEILIRLTVCFGCGHNIGEYEQDYCSTAQYGDRFLRGIEEDTLRLHPSPAASVHRPDITADSHETVGYRRQTCPT